MNERWEETEREKVSKAISSAKSYLKNLLDALAKSDEDRILKNVWRAAAETEYALFHMSLTHRDKQDGSLWKTRFRVKRLEISPAIICALSLLTESERINKFNISEAYKKVWMARGYLLSIQEIFEQR